MEPTRPTRRSFLKTAAMAAATAPLTEALAAPAQAGEARDRGGEGRLMAYVGTFSSPLTNVLPTQVDLPPGNGRGIHLFHVDRSTGALHPAGIHEMGNSPSCLAVNAAGTRLYSANETDKVGPNQEGTVSSFEINRDGSLRPLNNVSSHGAGPTYVSIHPSGRYLLVANYFGGTVAVLPIRSDGRLGEASDVKRDVGNLGPTKAPHAAPGSFAFSGHDRTHAHQIHADPTGHWVLHVELGQDRIYIWRFDEAKGTLNPAPTPFVTVPPGDGPRHVAFHPNGKWLYSIQEEGSTVTLWDWETDTGRMTERQTLSSLPEGYAGSNFCSEVLVSDDGRFVYAGNRLHDSIGVFAVGRDGRLKPIADEWTRGNYPRSFAFTPDGEFLYCCNQRADNVAIFRVNRRTGALRFTGQYGAVGNPSHVVFLELDRGR